MSIKLPVLFFLVLIALLSVSSHAFAFKAEPVSRPTLLDRNIYTTDLFTGSGYYTYTVPLPKGTADLTPSVTLDYNSHSTHDSQQFTGLGWQLSKDYVERNVNFTPESTSDDAFRLHFQGMTYDLVYVSGDGRYHTKIESNLNIKKLTSGAANDSGEYWQVITKDGTKYRFGNGTNSEQMCNGRSYVYRWNIDLVTDVHDNKIFYTHTESNGASFLSKIEYNTEKARVIDFAYTTNPYSREVYLQGCKVKEASRLSSIEVKTNSTTVRKFDLSYTNAGNLQQLLTGISEKGSDGTSALPSTSFAYNPEVKTWATQSATFINNVSLDAHLEMNTVALADVNGDGLTDIVRSFGNSPNNGWGTWKVLLNQGGNSWSTTYETWLSAFIDAWLGKADVGLFDVTGDNRADIIRTEQGNGAYATWKVWRNTGSSWSSTTETWVNNAQIDANLTQAGTTLVDVNGDGLADIVKSYQDGSNSVWRVFKNTGSSWNTTHETWFSAAVDARLDQAFTKLLDVNGDGLPDIVKTSTSSDWWVWKNTGSSWSTTQETWLTGSSMDAHFQKDEIAVADANGDGLIDIIKSIDNGTTDEWKVLLNKGDQWSTQWETWISPSSNVDVDAHAPNVRLADVTGDGLADIVQTHSNTSYNTWRVWKNNGHAPDTLAAITTSQGGTISYSYMKSTTVLNTGADMIPDLPFNLWIIETMAQNNGLTNSQQTNDVTSYTYGDGLFDYQDHEYRGFEDVYTVEPNGTKKHYVFNQDDAKKGRLVSVSTDDSNDNPYAKTEQTWSNTQSNGVYTVNLTMEKQYTYDGTASSPKIVQTDFDYDSYGNVTKKSETGDTSITTDDRFIYFYYVYNTTDWIVNTPKNTYRNASNDSTKVSETLFYYDGHTSLTDSPTKGDLTKEEMWLSGGTNPITTYAYDSYGNVTSITDDNSHTTSYSFGTNDTTRTYPDSMTNAKNQTTYYLYDLGTGNLLSKTDPNNLTTSYIYDIFGRVTKEIQPYDSTTYPTLSYTYSFDGTAPESTLVSKLEVSSASATLDMYTYTDGLGRTIQTRRDAEDTTKQIVVNTYYDPTGQVKKTSVPHLDTLSTSYASPVSGISVTQTTYDVLGRPTTITNPDSTTKTTGYNHWVLTNTNERGKVTKQYLNAFGKITQVDEVNGASTYSTTYTYNARDELTKITDHLGNEFDFVYDTLGRKTSQTDPDMGACTYAYDGVGNLTSQTDARSITTARSYDELNRLTLINYPTDSDNRFTYDLGKIGTLSIATDSAGTAFFTYDNRLRKTQEQRAINGTTKTTQFGYDAMNRLVTTTYPDGEVVTNSFNAQGEVNAVTGSSSIMSNIDYNALGKITKKDYANSLSTNYTYNTTDFRLNRIQTSSLQDLNYTYDNRGNIASITDSVASKTQLFSYDDLDRLKTATESAGYNYAYEYNAIGNLTKFTNSGVDTNYIYGEGAPGPHALTSSDASSSGAITVTNLTSASDTDGNSSATTASVTPGGNKLLLLTVSSRTSNSTDPNQPTITGNGLTWVQVGTSLFDNSGSTRRRVTVFRAMGASPSTGAVSISFSSQSQTHVAWSLDEFSGVDTSGTNGSGAIVQTVTNQDTTETATSLTATLSAFSGTNNATFGAFGTGALFTETAGSGFTQVGTAETTSLSTYTEFKNTNDTTVDMSWSSAQGIGVVAMEIKSASGGSSNVTVTNLTSSSDTDGNSTASTASVSPSANKLLLLTVASRTSSSTDPNQPTITGNGLTWVQVGTSLFDNSGSTRRRVTVFRAMGASPTSGTISIDFASQSQTHVAWSLDEFSGVDTSGTNGSGAIVQTVVNQDTTETATSLTVTLSAFASTSNATFGAFGTGALFTETAGSGFTLVGTAETTSLSAYTEFKSTNDTTVDMSWSSAQGIGGIAVELKAGSAGTTSYTYDANGNMTSDGTKCYQFNEANQLDKVTNCSSQTIAEYVYDYNGNRMVKRNFTNGTLANTVYSWSDSFETKVIVGGGTESTSYYFANTELIAKKNNDGSKYYYHNDHLGSTNVLTNSSGTVAETTKYDPWGEVASGGTASKFLYTGQEKDAETELHYYNFRYYDPSIRRFTQPDDIIPNIYNPQDLNRYSYVRNNPVRYTDPSGHFVFAAPVVYWVGAAVATAAVYLSTPQGQEQTKAAVSAVATVASQAVSAVGNAVTSVFNKPTTTAPPSNAAPKATPNSSSSGGTPSGGSPNPLNPIPKIAPAIPAVANAVDKVHGNDLRNTATTYGYTLRNAATGAIEKIGETMYPATRYTQEWLANKGLQMKIETMGTKFEMRVWEHEQIGEYIFKYGEAPYWNDISRSVNIFR